MALQIVTQLRALAAVEENRYFIVRDQGCLPGLVSFLSNDDEEIVFIALETLYFLSMYPGNRESIAKESGLSPKLLSLCDSSAERISNMARSTRLNLRGYVPAYESQNENMINCENPKVCNTTAQVSNPLRDATNKPGVSSLGLLAGVAKPVVTAKTYTVWVLGMVREDQRKEVESALVKIRGVVSFLLDIFSQKAIIRAVVSMETLVDAIQKVGYKVLLRQPTPSEAGGVSKEDEDLEYLPEEEEEEIGKFAVVTAQDAQAKKEENSGWFGRIAKSWWG